MTACCDRHRFGLPGDCGDLSPADVEALLEQCGEGRRLTATVHGVRWIVRLSVLHRAWLLSADTGEGRNTIATFEGDCGGDAAFAAAARTGWPRDATIAAEALRLLARLRFRYENVVCDWRAALARAEAAERTSSAAQAETAAVRAGVERDALDREAEQIALQRDAAVARAEKAEALAKAAIKWAEQARREGDPAERQIAADFALMDAVEAHARAAGGDP